ncbi:MAG: hypothetical protein K5898_09835 [Ruminococcus sp.]|uniref:hypothetical protein n=1 Tax=Ruminococcus sp. TaxID=41978 RepID=UPI0025E2E883|nr:hypothetical protein [Ruminococcus sp.]MCR4795448.1 hypothetical protein [Ruminococcus sp.]
MKDYKEIANSIFQRREEYLKEKKRKKALFIRNATIALSCCIMIAVGIGIWNIDMLRDIKPSPNKNDYTAPSPVLTTAETTDYNDITTETTAVTSADDILITTAASSAASAQSGTADARTTSAASHSSSGNVTTKKSDNNSSVTTLRTTASSIEITASNGSPNHNVRTTLRHSSTTTRTSYVRTTTTVRTSLRTSTTTRHATTTASKMSEPVYTRTTTAVYTRPAYTTTTTMRSPVLTSTTALYTRPAYTSTTIWYSPVATSTTRVYTTVPATSTTRVYTTTLAYNFTTQQVPVATSTPPWATTTVVKTSTAPPDIPALSTTTPISETPPATTTIPYFIYIDHVGFDVLDDRIPDMSLVKSYITSVDTKRYSCDIYGYMDYDPYFLCVAVFANGEARFLNSETFDPDSIGELIDTRGLWNNLNITGYLDKELAKYQPYSNKDSIYEFLDTYRNTPSYIDYPYDDRKDILCSLFFNVAISEDDNVPAFSGVMYLLENGKLEIVMSVEPIEFHFKFEVGEQAIAELRSMLR